ncbi:MAG: cytochrome oxidase putative small subunit CydP [Steroidobacteraceae bacterium]
MQSRTRYLSNAHRPGRDVFAALVFKGVLLLAIYLLFFSPTHRLPSDDAATARALIGASASKDVP